MIRVNRENEDRTAFSCGPGSDGLVFAAAPLENLFKVGDGSSGWVYN